MLDKDKLEYIRKVNSSHVGRHEVDMNIVSRSKVLSAVHKGMTVFGSVIGIVFGLAFAGVAVFIATLDASEMTVEGVGDADPKVFMLIFAIVFGIIGLSAVISSTIRLVKAVKMSARELAESSEYKEQTVFETTDENAVPEELQISEFEPSERRNMSSAYYFFHADNGTGDLHGGILFTIGGTGMAAIIVAAMAKTEPLTMLFALFPLIFAVLGVRMLVKEVKLRLKYVREMKERDRYTHD